MDIPSSIILTTSLTLGLYLYTAAVATKQLPTLTNARICLVIAHPDDEAMFFSPTVQHLTAPGPTANHLKIICLSSGNAEGLGETRKRELKHSGMVLGLRSEEDVYVDGDEERFPDSMTKYWDEEDVAELLCRAFAPDAAMVDAADGNKVDQQRGKKLGKHTATIDTLITFDAKGVSGHPNHISLNRGAKAFVKRLGGSKSSPVTLYTLTTVPVWRKYTAIFDCFATLAIWLLGMLMGLRQKSKSSSTNVTNRATPPKRLVFMNGLFGRTGFPRAWSAMTQAHVSQMVWFRYGWIILSRYMYMNDLVLESVAASDTKS